MKLLRHLSIGPSTLIHTWYHVALLITHKSFFHPGNFSRLGALLFAFAMLHKSSCAAPDESDICDECPEGSLCSEDGECSPICSSDTDCDDCQSCLSGLCVDSCREGELCRDGICEEFTCEEQTCQALGYECGMQTGACGESINCGECGGNFYCNAAECVECLDSSHCREPGGVCRDSRCVEELDCEERTCDQLGFECGMQTGACGEDLNCGGCPGSEHCLDGVCIEVGPPAYLAFLNQPLSTTAGAPLSPAIEIAIFDQHGYLVSDANDSVTIELDQNPESASLSGQLTVEAIDGIASFSDLRIYKAGTDYSISAFAQDLTSATSESFSISAAQPAALFFETQPTNSPQDASIRPAIKVGVEDEYGNPATETSVSISIALHSNPGSGLLSGTRTLNSVHGYAVFSDLSINAIGDGYSLSASSSGLDLAISANFNIIEWAFIFEIKIEPWENRKFSFKVDGAYYFDIDYGDGTGWQEMPNGRPYIFYNVYGDSGVYQVKVRGEATRISFCGGDVLDDIPGDEHSCEGTPQYLRDILTPVSAGVEGIESAFRMFKDATKITEFTAADFFDEASSGVNDMAEMFRGARKFNQDISNWDVFNVTRMPWMFSNAREFNQDIDSWDVANVDECMEDMFYGNGLSTANYDSLLNGWSRNQTIPYNVRFHAGNSKYSSSVAPDREFLRTNRGWIITDGGQR